MVSFVRSRAAGYCAALVIPVVATLVVTSSGMPAFVFEHLIVLLAVAVAMMWGMGPAVTAAVVATFADNLLFDDPVGRPAITGLRDVFDLALFITVAVAVAWLVARARRQESRAEAALERERQLRNDQDRLVATIAHDLATPLAAIRGTVQFANDFGTHPEVDMTRLLGRVETAASRATSLVRTLTDIRAFERGDLALTLEVIDFRDVTAPVVQMFERMSTRHCVRLALPQHPVMLRCDGERLQRVIENLMSNAIKYSPDGGTVDVSIAVDGGDGVLSIRDQGIGISASSLSLIFERAYRAPEAIAAAPGLGLGLTISLEIVKRHGGVMEVVSQGDSTGSMVTIRLPLADAASPSGVQSSRAQPTIPFHEEANRRSTRPPAADSPL
jgi:signal transduction histidine kinase